MNELENKMVKDETEYILDDEEYDSYMNALAERDDKRWEDYEDD